MINQQCGLDIYQFSTENFRDREVFVHNKFMYIIDTFITDKSKTFQ